MTIEIGKKYIVMAPFVKCYAPEPPRCYEEVYPVIVCPKGTIIKLTYIDKHQTCPFVVGIDSHHIAWGGYYTKLELQPIDPDLGFKERE
jgi:hypothetical protein